MAARSLSVQQQATEVAGQNLANVNNPAYARQQLNMQTSSSVDTPAGQEGTGVQAISITQVRDGLLDNQIQSEGSVASSLTSQQNALEDAQTYLNEQISSQSTSASGTSATGLTAAISGLFNSFQSLAGAPSDPATQQAVVAAGQAVTQQFNSISSGLATVQSNLNASITSDVAGANQDLTDIAALNRQIIIAHASGGTANDLVDLRQQKIEDLSSKVNITTLSQPDGSLDVRIGGTVMVTGSDTPDSLQTFDAGGGQILVRAQNGGNTLDISGGSVGGNITARDGALATLQTSLNTLASQMATSINSIYSAGFSSKGTTGQNFFTGTTAAGIGVNSGLVADSSTLQYSGTGASGDNSVALALAQLSNQKISGLNGDTISVSYTKTVGALGTALSSVNDQVTNTTAVTTMLANQRSSVSGVSTDEELTNLVQFQKAYQASAELITTLNEMLTTLIAMKTV